MASALSTIAKELDMNSAQSVMALSIYLLATAFGPLVIGPLSEIYGRQRILHVSDIWFLVWNFACGFAYTKGLLIAARFLAGFGASSVYALAGGVLGDVWSPEQRGRSLGMYLLIPLLGAAVSSHDSFTSFRETYAPLILQTRAEKLRKETGDQQFKLGKSVFMVTSRPCLFLDELLPEHHLGLHYIACVLGEVAGSQIGGPLMDYIFRRMQASRDTSSQTGELYVPEFRIPLMFPGAFLAPLGFLLYGWAGQYQLHWLVVDVGIFVVTFGMQIAGMPLTAYVMDAYVEHTSSAAAASQFLKSLTAFIFLLFAPKMYEVLGYGWGSTSMAIAGLVFGFPAPLILWY
ncbi:hypothetical protein QQZ08_005276 [Neonectria magnoliae]|uniref:Major facilitator superfamily (MFS) profile domain-containing protein n=1 Tax=Neonectria magnoliae TaxID=2732573 RepID=A0ABR1I5C6_9HYPO